MIDQDDAKEALAALNEADECFQPETLDELRKHFKTIRAALKSAAQATPPTHVLAPREPTQEMLNAGFQELEMDEYCAGIVYRAMLAAIPQAEGERDDA